jgi:hypothetical protein
MKELWNSIKQYYHTLGEKYSVDPVLFLAIHIVATPLFILAVSWLLKNFKRKKPLFLPVITALFIFNAANIYLVLSGRNIPWYIYFILGITTLISGFFSYRKIRTKMKSV